MSSESLDKIKEIIQSSASVKQNILADDRLLHEILKAVDAFTEALSSNHRIWLCGNGGSAADAQHIAAELSGRFYIDRIALPVEALHVNSSYLTAVANDYGFDDVYSRMVEGIGQEGDILMALSTSGNSKNIINAIHAAKNKNMKAIGLTGQSGGKMKDICDILIHVPSDITPRIQEAHILIGHIICEIVEERLFS